MNILKLNLIMLQEDTKATLSGMVWRNCYYIYSITFALILFIFSFGSKTSSKSDLGIVLDEAYPNAGDLRLEARMIFMGRIIYSVYAVLLKHDQVLVPVSTRFARV